MRINVGCGLEILPGWVNADIAPLRGVDVVCDLDDIWPWDDNAADEVFAKHVFEHVSDPVLFMAEAWRVLKPGGILTIFTPYYRHMYAFTDPTHKRFCTEMTWDYWTPGTNLHEYYGTGFGSVPGGPRFEKTEMLLASEEEGKPPCELRVALRKLE
jgi:SAM-dependent methyltransferase